LTNWLVAEELAREAEALHGEGWKWIAAATDFSFAPFGQLALACTMVGAPNLPMC